MSSSKKGHRSRGQGGGSRKKTTATPPRTPRPTGVGEQLVRVAERYISALRRRDFDAVRDQLLSSDSVAYLKLYTGSVILQRGTGFPASFTVTGITFDVQHVAEELVWEHPEVIPRLLAGFTEKMEEQGWLGLSPTRNRGIHTRIGTHQLLMLDNGTGKPCPLFFVDEGGQFLIDLKAAMVFGGHPDAQRLFELAEEAFAAGDTARALYYFKTVGQLDTTYDVLDQLWIKNVHVARSVTAERREWLESGRQYVAMARRRVLELEDIDAQALDLSSICARGEGQTIEFMDRFPSQAHDLAKEIAAFGSSNAGYIYLGIDNGGNVVGMDGTATLEDRDSLRQRIANTANTIEPPIRPVVRFIDVEVEGTARTVVSIAVIRGSEPVYYSTHRPYIRDGQMSRPARPAEVQHLVQAHATRYT